MSCTLRSSSCFAKGCENLLADSPIASAILTLFLADSLIPSTRLALFLADSLMPSTRLAFILADAHKHSTRLAPPSHSLNSCLAKPSLHQLYSPNFPISSRQIKSSRNTVKRHCLYFQFFQASLVLSLAFNLQHTKTIISLALMHMIASTHLS